MADFGPIWSVFVRKSALKSAPKYLDRTSLSDVQILQQQTKFFVDRWNHKSWDHKNFVISILWFVISFCDLMITNLWFLWFVISTGEICCEVGGSRIITKSQKCDLILWFVILWSQICDFVISADSRSQNLGKKLRIFCLLQDVLHGMVVLLGWTGAVLGTTYHCCWYVGMTSYHGVYDLTYSAPVCKLILLLYL